MSDCLEKRTENCLLRSEIVLFAASSFAALFLCFSLSSDSQAGEPTVAPSYFTTLIKIEIDYSSYENVLKASARLKEEIEAAYEAMPANFHEEIKQSLDNRLAVLLVSTKNYRVKDYQAAMMAMRLLELSGNLHELPYRSLGITPEIRQSASQQYAALLSYVEEQFDEKNQSLNRSVARLVYEALGEVLLEVQSNIIRYGYGETVSEEKYEILLSIIDSTIDKAIELSSTLEPDGLPPRRLREAAGIANDGRSELRKSIQEDSFQKLSKITAVLGLARWAAKTKSLQSAISLQADEASQKEMAFIIQMDERQDLPGLIPGPR